MPCMLRPARHPRLTLWLVPLLLWQLMLPPGVMPGATEHGSTLVLCDMHHGPMAPLPGHRDTAPGSHHGGSMCPFAAVGAIGPLAVNLAVAAHGAPVALAIPFPDAQRAVLPLPSRAHRSRGPPALS